MTEYSENNEIWKLISGSEHYEVSSKGRIRRTAYDKICYRNNNPYILHIKEFYMKLLPTWDGYLSVGIPYDGKFKDKFVHRLVAEQFLDTWDPSLQVNHINGNKADNRVENLEMVTCKENIHHFYNHPLMKDRCIRKKINQSMSSKEVMSRIDVKIKESEKQGKHVLCIEDNVAFSSRSVCAKFYNVSYDLIDDRCKNGISNKSFKLRNKNFRYMSEDEYQSFKNSNRGKVVIYV